MDAYGPIISSILFGEGTKSEGCVVQRPDKGFLWTDGSSGHLQLDF